VLWEPVWRTASAFHETKSPLFERPSACPDCPL
jgi:hypothetical protein